MKRCEYTAYIMLMCWREVYHVDVQSFRGETREKRNLNLEPSCHRLSWIARVQGVENVLLLPDIVQ